jgi:hypothetical protein
MSGKKNKSDIERRQSFVLNEIQTRKGEKIENVINDIAEKLFLRPSTIWRDLQNAKSQPVAGFNDNIVDV